MVDLDSDEPLKPVADVETIRVDLTSDRSVPEAFHSIGARIASVIHLAAYYDLSGEPDPKYKAVLLRGLREGCAVEQFVLASTMLVHAPTEPGRPISEDWPLEPKWPYPQSKVETE